MPTKKKAAKSPKARKKINITIDMGTFPASSAERDRLKEFVNNQVLTWAKYDTAAGTNALVLSRESPPPGGLDPED